MGSSIAQRLKKHGLLGAFVSAFALAFAQVGAVSVHAGDPAPKAPPPLPTASASSPVARPLSGSADLVVLISLDGLRPDAIAPDMRGLHRLYLQGATPHVARTITKSATLPAHASMVSGVDASQHHLDFNAYKPERGAIAVPTIFSLVQQAGLPTAMFVGKGKLRHLLAHPNDSSFKVGGLICEKQLKDALPYLQSAERGLLFLHFADPDSAGHRFGWMSAEYVEAVMRADRCLERVLDVVDHAGHKDRTLVIVTSDHGGHNKSHGTRLDVDQHIPWYALGAGVQHGRIKRAVHTTDTAATVLAALGVQRPAYMQGQPVLEALKSLGPTGMALLGGPIPEANEPPR